MFSSSWAGCGKLLFLFGVCGWECCCNSVRAPILAVCGDMPAACLFGRMMVYWYRPPPNQSEHEGTVTILVSRVPAGNQLLLPCAAPPSRETSWHQSPPTRKVTAPSLQGSEGHNAPQKMSVFFR